MDDWVSALREACARTSQGRVAEHLRQPDGYPSPAVINQVLRGRYQGRIDRLRGLVEGEYLGVTVPCPVLGEISRRDCLEHQARPFASTNFRRIQLFRACRGGCPHSCLED
jgi:hypothetical protein